MTSRTQIAWELHLNSKLNRCFDHLVELYHYLISLKAATRTNTAICCYPGEEGIKKKTISSIERRTRIRRFSSVKQPDEAQGKLIQQGDQSSMGVSPINRIEEVFLGPHLQHIS